MKERRPSGEPALAEVGPPVILSPGIAGYLSVRRTADGRSKLRSCWKGRSKDTLFRGREVAGSWWPENAGGGGRVRTTVVVCRSGDHSRACLSSVPGHVLDWPQERQTVSLSLVHYPLPLRSAGYNYLSSGPDLGWQ
jgi:hypothetical protein